MRLHGAVLAALFPGALAIYLDEAFEVDFHYPLLGLPVSTNTFFHQPNPASKASLVYTLTEKLVAAAVNPKDGQIVWRQPLSINETSRQGFLRSSKALDTVVSAVDDRVSAWGAEDGRLAWQFSSQGSAVKGVEILDVQDGDGVGDVILLLDGPSTNLYRLDGRTGEAKWTFEDSSGDVPLSISSSDAKLHYISLQSTLLKGVKIKVTSLDPNAGNKLEHYTLSSDSDISSSDSILFVGANVPAPIIAWTDDSKKQLKVNVIGSKNVASFAITNTAPGMTVKIEAPHGLNSSPHFLVHYQTLESHWAEVYHINLKDQSVSKAYDLPKLEGQGAFAASVTDANVYFLRITQDEITLVSTASHSVLQRWMTGSVMTGGKEQLYPVHAAAEVVSRSESKYAVRSTIQLSNGDWVLVRNGDTVWSRPEALSGIIQAEWAELHENPQLVDQLKLEASSSLVAAYLHRLKRHMLTLQTLAIKLQVFPQLLMRAVYDSFTEHGGKSPSTDRFGFHTLMIVATENGRLIALDHGSRGRVLWNLKAEELGPNERWNASSVGSISAKLLNMGQHAQELGVAPSWLEGTKIQDAALEIQNQNKGSTNDVHYRFENGILQGSKHENHVWDFKPSPGHNILNVVTALLEEPIASIGKILGDRRVLYKYLNPNAVLVITADETHRSISVYLLDSVTGGIIHSISHVNVDTKRPIPAVMSENWFSYSFTTDPAGDGMSKGYEIVMAELYESPLPNDRGSFGASTEFSSSKPRHADALSSKPHVVAQTFHVPEEISILTVTQTQQGITSRELLATLSGSNSIVGIPRFALDPRRPIGKDPTNEQMEEGLSKYSPVIEFDPKWYLNHKQEIMGVREVMTTPALLESTGLVFAYGLDLFGTRVSPSFAFDNLGKGFNKIQLVLTVLALLVGTFVAAPLINRKQVNALWQTA